MNSLYLILFLCVILLSRKVGRELYNPIFLFVTFWTILLSLSVMNLFEQNAVSSRTYMCVVLGVVSFAMGGFSSSVVSDNKRKSETVSMAYANKIPPMMYVSMGVVIILSIYLLRSMSLMSSGITLDYIRTNFTTLVISSNIERLVWSFVIYPLSLTTMSIDLYAYFIEKKKVYLAISLLITVFIALTSGGRVYFFFFLLQVIYFALMSGRASKMKNIILFIILLFFSYNIVDFISSSRQIETSQTESLYVYFTGCFPFMESKMQQIDSMGFNSYGLAFFNAPVTFVEMLLKNVGLMDYTPLLMKTNDFINSLQEYENIGSANFNAFTSVFFAYYMDGGIVGIILESFLFGYYSTYVFKNVKYRKSPLSIVIYAMIINAIFTSFVRWQFGRLEFFLSLFYIWIFLRKSKLKFSTK